MKWLSFLKKSIPINTLGVDPSVEEENIIRELVEEYSSGSVSLTSGHIITRDDMERSNQEFEGYSFVH